MSLVIDRLVRPTVEKVEEEKSFIWQMDSWRKIPSALFGEEEEERRAKKEKNRRSSLPSYNRKGKVERRRFSSVCLCWQIGGGGEK